MHMRPTTTAEKAIVSTERRNSPAEASSRIQSRTHVGTSLPDVRHPEAANASHSMCELQLYQAAPQMLSPIKRIEETSAREIASVSCDQCKLRGLVCRVYTPDARQALSTDTQSGHHKCSSCRERMQPCFFPDAPQITTTTAISLGVKLAVTVEGPGSDDDDAA